MAAETAVSVETAPRESHGVADGTVCVECPTADSTQSAAPPAAPAATTFAAYAPRAPPAAAARAPAASSASRALTTLNGAVPPPRRDQYVAGAQEWERNAWKLWDKKKVRS